MNDRIRKVLDILKQNLPEGTDVNAQEIAKANGVTRTGIVIRHPAIRSCVYLSGIGRLG